MEQPVLTPTAGRRNPAGRVMGYGSTHEGLSHWTRERVTAIALVPLGIWFVAACVSLSGAPYEAVRAWLASPWNTTFVLLTVALSFWHAKLGMQVIIEDYVHGSTRKAAALLANTFVNALLGTACAVAALKISLGGG